jgi:hypothetical protein
MPVSARPLVSQRALWRRVWRVVPTFAASWPEGAAWRRARDAAPAPAERTREADQGLWSPVDEGWRDEPWAPGLGR